MFFKIFVVLLLLCLCFTKLQLKEENFILGNDAIIHHYKVVQKSKRIVYA